jgi:hypothetical protein
LTARRDNILDSTSILDQIALCPEVPSNAVGFRVSSNGHGLYYAHTGLNENFIQNPASMMSFQAAFLFRPVSISFSAH